MAEPQEESLHVHAFFAAQLQVRDGDGPVGGGDGKVGFAVAEHRARSGVKVCAHFAEKDLQLQGRAAILRHQFRKGAGIG